MMAWTESGEDVVARLSTSVLHGLSASDVENARAEYGENKLEAEEKDHIVIRFLETFKDPLIMMLLGSVVLSVLVGQYEDAFSIAAAVLIVGSVAFYQEYQSEQSLEALTTLVPPRCNVLRAGRTTNILAEELVPGDVVKVIAGDRVPADARIITCNSLSVDESSLTGEAEPRNKVRDELPNLDEHANASEKINMLFMGTLVTSGNGVAIVVSIASNTEFGKTFMEMKQIENKRTPLQCAMDELGKKLSIFSFILIAIIGCIGMMQGQSFFTMFNIGVSLAVAAIPEGLPICVTVTLALGVMRMAKKNAIVRKLPAVEALGCANYICCDKTGTLTENRMSVVRAFSPSLDDCMWLRGVEAAQIVAGGSAGPGAAELMKPHIDDDTSREEETENLARLAGSMTLNYHQKQVSAHDYPALLELFDAACLCNNACLTGHGVVGQPTEGALLIVAAQLGLPDRRNSLRRVEEDSFNSDTKYMRVVYADRKGSISSNNGSSSSATTTLANATSRRVGSGSFDDGNSTMGFVKGALEVVLPMCVSYFNHMGDQVLLDSSTRDLIHMQALDMANDGLRVLAVAKGTSSNQYTFCGILGLMDPLREGVKEAVARMQNSGARVVMITGDAKATAMSISKLAGIHDADEHDMDSQSYTNLVAAASSSSSSSSGGGGGGTRRGGGGGSPVVPGSVTATTSSSSSSTTTIGGQGLPLYAASDTTKLISGTTATTTTTTTTMSSRRQRIISGDDIENIVRLGGGEAALATVIEDVVVCYRTNPRHKLYIVRALQSRGHVVSMTGDGVNDAPALKAADIGVAVGSGNDVAKEAADMVIVDDDFSTIVNAIEEGKGIFYNIKNFLTFQLSTSIAALSLVALNNLIGRPNPLNPMQILWINIIMDGPLAQSLGVETVDPTVMARPPRRREDDIITLPLMRRVVTSGILILIGTMYVFLSELDDGGRVTARDLTMTFTTFVMFDMCNSYSCRHNSFPVFNIEWNSNKAYLFAFFFVILGQILVVYFPPLQKVFRTEALAFSDIAMVLALSSTMLVLDTLRKVYFPHLFTEVVHGVQNSDGYHTNPIPGSGPPPTLALSPLVKKAKSNRDREEEGGGGGGREFAPATPLGGALGGLVSRISLQIGSILKVQRMFNKKEQEEDGSMV